MRHGTEAVARPGTRDKRTGNIISFHDRQFAVALIQILQILLLVGPRHGITASSAINMNLRRKAYKNNNFHTGFPH